MTPAQIEGFIDRICGLFPSTTIAKNSVKNAWTADDFLLLQDVNDARKVIPIIMNNYDKFPTLKQTRQAFRELYEPAGKPLIVCEICDGNGWDTGVRWDFANKIQISSGFTKQHNEQTYSYVKPCKCKEASIS